MARKPSKLEGWIRGRKDMHRVSLFSDYSLFYSGERPAGDQSGWNLKIFLGVEKIFNQHFNKYNQLEK